MKKTAIVCKIVVLLPFILLCLMHFAIYVALYTSNHTGEFALRSYVVGLIFVSLIRITLVASIIMIIVQFVKKRIKAKNFGAITLLVLCVIAATLMFYIDILNFTIYFGPPGLWPRIAQQLFVDQRSMVSFLLLLIAILGFYVQSRTSENSS